MSVSDARSRVPMVDFAVESVVGERKLKVRTAKLNLRLLLVTKAYKKPSSPFSAPKVPKCSENSPPETSLHPRRKIS